MRTSTGSVGGAESTRLQRRHLVGRVLAPGLLAVGGAAVAPVLAGATTNQQVATATVAGVGRVVVFGHRVVYMHSTDTRRHSTCTGVCATVWPPLVVSGQAAHHLGHLHGLGTIRRPNGRLQVTINGHPLYFFSGDKNLTAVGQGFLNMWFTVRANGTAVHVVKANAAPATPAAPAPKSSTTTTTQGSHSSGTQMPVAPVPTTTPPTSPPAPPTTTPTSPPTTTTTSPPPTTTTTAPGGGGVSF
jgi:predicted lipoprotein with Yx(FWY)xxD motif